MRDLRGVVIVIFVGQDFLGVDGVGAGLATRDDARFVKLTHSGTIAARGRRGPRKAAGTTEG